MINFPDPISNEAALPQLEDLLTRILVLPLRVRVATGPEGSPLAEQLSVLHRRYPLQFTPVTGHLPSDEDTRLIILPGVSETPSTVLPNALQAGKPVLAFASLAARQVVEAARDGGRTKVSAHWFYRSDIEALWDAAWSCIDVLRLLESQTAAAGA